MNRKSSTIGIALLLMLAASTGFGQQEPAREPIPVIDPQTFLVIRFDMNQLDANLLGKWVTEVIGGVDMPAEEKEAAVRDFPRNFGMIGQFRDALVQAGTEHIYLVWSMADVRQDDEPTMYATVSPTGNPALVAGLLYSGPGRNDIGPELANAQPNQRVAAELGDGVFMGRKQRYDRLAANQGTNEAVARMLAEAPPSGLFVAFAPSDEYRQFIARELARMPAPFGPTLQALLSASREATGVGQFPPGVSARIAVQTANNAAATQAKAELDKFLQWLTTPVGRGMLMGIDPQPIVQMLSPKVEDNQLIIELDDAQVSRLVQGPLTLALMQARRTARAMQSMSIIRMQLQGIIIYANENRGALPDKLDDIQRFVNQGLVNPRGVLPEPDYIYRKVAARFSDVPNPAGAVMIYENPKDLPPNVPFINVGFADGHVESWMLGNLEQYLKENPLPAGN